MKKIMFICSGNTCRSPLAEGLFKKYLTENNITLHKNDIETVGEYPVQIIALSRTPNKGSEVKDNT